MCYSVSSADSAIATQESAEIFEEETPNKVKKVELEIQSDKEDSSTSTNSDVGKFSFALLFVEYDLICTVAFIFFLFFF